MDDRDRAAPGPLARHPSRAGGSSPCAADAAAFSSARRSPALASASTSSRRGSANWPACRGRYRPRRRHVEGRGVGAGRHHDRRHRQAVFAGEIQVALVMRRAAEDRAGAVAHQHEIGDHRPAASSPDRRDARGQAGVEAQLLGRLDLGLGGAGRRHSAMKAASFGSAFASSWASGWSGEIATEAGAEQRVGPGGEDTSFVVRHRQREGKRRPFGLRPIQFSCISGPFPASGPACPARPAARRRSR
jgi:hypothetical protein